MVCQGTVATLVPIVVQLAAARSVENWVKLVLPGVTLVTVKLKPSFVHWAEEI